MAFDAIIAILYCDDYVQLAGHFINCLHNGLCLVGEHLAVGPLAKNILFLWSDILKFPFQKETILIHPLFLINEFNAQSKYP